MGEVVKHYSNDAITILWKPGLCQHSEKCWRGLGEVFDPKGKPWINVEGAAPERIVQQVAACPSGALSIKTEAKDQKA